MLDIESFTYLNRALESTISPHVILATNRGLATIRGTEHDASAESGILSPHGLPIDLLDRCMIVRTLPYSRSEIHSVLGIRARVEGLAISAEALDHLADEGSRTSLRFVSQLLYPSSILARLQGRTQIELEDVKESDSLFLDARASARMLGSSQGSDGLANGVPTAGREEYMR